MNETIRDGQYAQVGNPTRPLRLHYASCGDEGRPLLLMLHGFPEGWFDAETRAEYHDGWRRPGALRAALDYYRASPLHPPKSDDADVAHLALDESRFVVRVPTLVLWGERDTALLPVLLDGLEHLVPQLRIVRLTDATHWLVHEQPRRVAREIAAFVDDVNA